MLLRTGEADVSGLCGTGRTPDATIVGGGVAPVDSSGPVPAIEDSQGPGASAAAGCSFAHMSGRPAADEHVVCLRGRVRQYSVKAGLTFMLPWLYIYLAVADWCVVSAVDDR